jgi:hypothetical protein
MVTVDKWMMSAMVSVIMTMMSMMSVMMNGMMKDDDEW